MKMKEIRKALGMSRADMADALGTSPRTIEGYEQGRKSIDKAHKLTQKAYAELGKRAGKI